MARGWVHTVHRKDKGDWANEVERNKRASSLHPNKAEAVKRGRDLPKATKTEHVIHKLDRTIGERNSYGNDPNPPAG
jgi:Uncharacterized protein conserved in bacteria (DUF2188)